MIKPYRAVYETTLTAEDLQKACKELNETPETRITALDALRGLLTKERFIQSRVDEDFLIKFLRWSKFDVEEAFQMVKKHYRFRRQHPNLFRSPSEMLHILRSGMIRCMPFRDKQGRCIVFLKTRAWDPDKVSHEDITTAVYIVMEYIASNPVTQINGFVVVADVQGVGFRQARAASISGNIRIINLFQGCFPARFKIFYGVNTNRLTYSMWQMVSFLISKKLKNRVMFTKQLSQLREEIDPQLLPVEYGGEIIFDEEEFIQKLMESNLEIERDRTYGYAIAK